MTEAETASSRIVVLYICQRKHYSYSSQGPHEASNKEKKTEKQQQQSYQYHSLSQVSNKTMLRQQ